MEDTPLPLILLTVEYGVVQGLATTDLEGHGRRAAEVLEATGAYLVIVLKRTLVLTSEAYGPDEFLLVGLLLLGSLPHLALLLGGVVMDVGDDDGLGFGRKGDRLAREATTIKALLGCDAVAADVTVTGGHGGNVLVGDELVHSWWNSGKVHWLLGGFVFALGQS